jgi:hypothetical protein
MHQFLKFSIPKINLRNSYKKNQRDAPVSQILYSKNKFENFL